MTRLLRLYPAAWRDRYGDELTDLLAENPPSVGDMIDLARGALDAHMHRSMVPATAAAGGSVPLPSDVPVARRRIPVGAFLGTLSAGLFLLTAASIQLERSIPTVWVQLPSMLLAFASIALGLTLLLTTGRAIIAKLAGLAFLLGLMFLFWTGAYLPTGGAILLGSALLTVGSILEGRPSRTIGAGTAGLTLALWTSYNADLEMIAPIIAGYGLVALGLALSATPAWRPVVLGVGATAVVVSAAWAVAVAISPFTLHDGYVIQCGETSTQVCVNRIDLMVERLRTIRSSDPIVSAVVSDDGSAQICTTVMVAAGGRNPFDEDPAWVERLMSDTTLGIQLSSVGVDSSGTTMTCWRD